MNEIYLLLFVVVVVIGFFVYQGWRFVCLKVDRARIESIRRETLHDGSVVLVYGVSHGALLYEHFANEPEPARTVTPVTKPDEVGALAVSFVEASIAFEKHLAAMNGQHKKEHVHGAQGRQLLTCDECLAARLVANRDDYQAAVDWLKSRGYVASYNGHGMNGIYSNKPLAEVMRDLAVAALPEMRAN